MENWWCWIDAEQPFSLLTWGSLSRGILWSLSTSTKTEKEREKSTVATLRALSFGQRVQGGFKINLSQPEANYTSVSPTPHVCCPKPPTEKGVTLKVSQTNFKLLGLLAVSLEMTFMWKCFRNIKVNHPLSLLASSSRVKRTLNSSLFFPTKWIRTSLNVSTIMWRNRAQLNTSLYVSSFSHHRTPYSPWSLFKKKKVKQAVL